MSDRPEEQIDPRWSELFEQLWATSGEEITPEAKARAWYWFSAALELCDEHNPAAAREIEAAFQRGLARGLREVGQPALVSPEVPHRFVQMSGRKPGAACSVHKVDRQSGKVSFCNKSEDDPIHGGDVIP